MTSTPHLHLSASICSQGHTKDELRAALKSLEELFRELLEAIKVGHPKP